MSQDNCAICLCELAPPTVTLPNCPHVYHESCIRTLYLETFNHFDPNTGRRLTPTCPQCRKPFTARDLPQGPFTNPVAAARRRAEIARVISEPSYAAMPESQRPIRLARAIILVERGERERALNELIEERNRIRAIQASREAPMQQPQQLQQPAPPRSPEPRPSTSRGSRGVTGSPALKKSRVYMESDTSSSSSPGSIRQGVISENPVASQPTAGPSRIESTPRKLQPSPELQDLNVRIHIAQMQLSQMSDESNHPIDLNELPVGEVLEPEWVPQAGEEDLQPMSIIGTWGRGRNLRYKIRWSDGSCTLNRTREVEERASELLENYRRELKRIATAKTREKQRSGEAPKVPGRGRGRGRRGGGAGGSRESS